MQLLFPVQFTFLGLFYFINKIFTTCRFVMKLQGIYLLKALSCMKIFLYKQELLFCQGDQEVTLKRLISMLPITQKLFVGV